MKILKYLPEWTNCHVTFRNVVAHGKWVRSVDAAVEMGQKVTGIKKQNVTSVHPSLSPYGKFYLL